MSKKRKQYEQKRKIYEEQNACWKLNMNLITQLWRLCARSMGVSRKEKLCCIAEQQAERLQLYICMCVCM